MFSEEPQISWGAFRLQKESDDCTAAGAPEIDPEEEQLIASDQIGGAAVYTGSGQRLGTIERVILSRRDGFVRYAVVALAEARGSGTRTVALRWDELDHDDVLEGYVVPLELTDWGAGAESPPGTGCLHGHSAAPARKVAGQRKC